MSSNLSNIAPNDVDLKQIIRSYTKHWKWFILSVIVAIGLAMVYIRYATPEYNIQAKIQFLEESGDNSGLNLLKDLGVGAGSNNNVEDEVELITSRSNLIETVKKLGLNTKILALGNVKDSELYLNPPVNINFFAEDTLLYNTSYTFFIEFSSTTTFGYAEERDGPYKVYPFGKTFNTPIGDIVITPNLDSSNRYLHQKFQVNISPVSSVVASIQQILSVGTAGDLSNIVEISLEYPIPRKGIDIINSLIETYNKNVVLDKKAIADRTSDFINDRIARIASSLSSVDENAQEFKSGKGITDIASEANINLNIGASNRQQLENASVQLDIANSMKEIVENQDGFDVLPSNVGLSDPSIGNTTQKYNELVLERKRLLKSSNEKNPIIVNLDQQLSSLKETMESSLNSVSNNLAMTVNNLSGQQQRINSRIYSVPKNERALRDITRQQQTTESLYLYLLQKREESQIAYASAKPKTKVVDYAYSSQFPVSPKVTLIFMASFIFGLLIPFSLIYAKDLLDSKIHNKIASKNW